jgi:transposase
MKTRASSNIEKSLTPEQIKRAITAIKEGIAYRQVANRFSVSVGTLRRLTGVKAQGMKGKWISLASYRNERKRKRAAK